MPALHPRPTDEQEAALALLRGGQSFLLVGHVRPDGDCLGSQAALAHLLQGLGKRVQIRNPDPAGPEFAPILAGLDVRSGLDDPLPEHEICVLLDINDLGRCGDLEGPLREAPSLKLVVDHHLPSGPPADLPFWEAAFLDTSASATGLLVARIAHALDLPLTGPAAEAVFLALATDTGWFRYANTDAETLGLAAQLVASGVEPNAIHMRLHQQEPAGYPGAIAELLQGLQLSCDGRLALLPEPLPGPGSTRLAEPGAVLDLVRAVGSVEVVLHVRLLEDGTCKLSARSKTAFDVRDLAAVFGGGGHSKAAGAPLPWGLDEACRKVREEAERRLLVSDGALAATTRETEVLG